MYTIQLDGENLHYYWNNAYGWGAISSTDNKNGSPVLFESQSEAEEWISGKLVFCKGAKVIEIENKKRGRGRPATGAALTPAQKQKAYRERIKSNVTEKESTEEEVEKLREMARAEFKRAEGLQAQVIDMGLKIAQLENKVTELEIAQLEHEVKKIKQDASPSRLNQGMKKIIQDVHDVADALEGSTWRIQRKARANGEWKTLRGSYWNEAKAEDALAEIPSKKGSWWRIIEVKSEVKD